MANAKPTQIITNEVRISYEHLLKPYVQQPNAQQPNAEPKYSATILIPKSDFVTKQRIDAAIQATIIEGISSKWGGVRPPNVPLPIHDGDGVRPSDGLPFGAECKGHWVMSASSKQQPELVDLNLQRIIDATQIYSGMYARVSINFFAYFNKGKKGIGCGLGPVQKTRDGELLGGRVSAEEAFGSTAPAAQPQYQPAPQPQYAPQPAYAPQPQYQQPTQPQYQQPAQPTYAQPLYQPAPQPQYAPQPAPAPAPAIDPITGLPVQPPIYGI